MDATETPDDPCQQPGMDAGEKIVVYSFNYRYPSNVLGGTGITVIPRSVQRLEIFSNLSKSFVKNDLLLLLISS